MLSVLTMRFVRQKNQELTTSEKLETMIMKECIFSFLDFTTSSLQKLEGTKRASDSQRSCLNLPLMR